MATACGSWRFHESEKAATDCLMAAESASAMLECICAHATAAENESRKETANVALTRVENIASSCTRLPLALRAAIIQLIVAGSKSPMRHSPAKAARRAGNRPA